MTDHVQLDDPATDDERDPEDGPEFPNIEPQRFTDAYSGAVVTFEVIEGDNPGLVVTHGGPNDEVFVRFKLSMPEAFLFQLAEKFIQPLRDYRELENQHTRQRMQKDHEDTQAELAARPFRAASTGHHTTGRDYDLRVHLRDCHHAVNTVLDKGSSGTTGTFSRARYRDDLPLCTGADVIRMLASARKALDWCYSPLGVQSNARRAKERDQGRVRHTALDYQPVRFCRTCKPLGEHTAEINATLRDLSNLTELDDTADQRAAATFTTIEQAVWETEQAHLDTLRGNHITAGAIR